MARLFARQVSGPCGRASPWERFAANGSGRGRGSRQPAVESRPRSNREETHAIREWARQHGHQVNDRGRIPKSVIEAYQAAS
jgi:Lsr2